MQPDQQYAETSRLLSPLVKRKVLDAVPGFLRATHTLWRPAELLRAAIDALRPSFPAASAAELEVLAFYLLGSVAAKNGQVTADLSKLHTSVESQVSAMTLLSNMIKSSSEMQKTVVQNIR